MAPEERNSSQKGNQPHRRAPLSTNVLAATVPFPLSLCFPLITVQLYPGLLLNFKYQFS